MASAQQILIGGAGMDAETITWASRVVAAGGTFESNSLYIADRLIRAVKAEAYNSGIKYILPHLGGNLAAAIIPLRDSLNVGGATNTGFVNGDFSQATGISAASGTKYLDSKIKPSQLGTGLNAGLGCWARAVATTGAHHPIGCVPLATNSQSYYLHLNTTFKNFGWNSDAVAGRAELATASTAGDYYGQRASSASRILYLNGSSIATNTIDNTPGGSSNKNIFMMGIDASEVGAGILPWYGNSSCFYMTDGTLSAANIAAFHTLLQTYLITPTGR